MKTIVPHAEVVDLRGWGESSLDPRLPKLIDKISQLGKKTVLYTNLNTHNPSYWKNIIKKGTFLAISIESGNKENYKKIRRGGNLEVVKNNLKAIIEECDKNSTFPRPFFTTVISEKNVKEIKSLVDFGLEVGINEIELNPLSRPYHLNKPLGRWFGVLPEFEHETNCYLNDAYEYAKEKGIPVVYTYDYGYGSTKKAPEYLTVVLNLNANQIPVINAGDKELTVGDVFDAKEGVTAWDEEDGDITDRIEVVSNNVDASKAGKYEVTYKVTDSQGESVSKTITVTVVEKSQGSQEPGTGEKPEDGNKPEGNQSAGRKSAWQERKQSVWQQRESIRNFRRSENR